MEQVVGKVLEETSMKESGIKVELRGKEFIHGLTDLVTRVNLKSASNTVLARSISKMEIYM